jgi:hypothetical protein
MDVHRRQIVLLIALAIVVVPVLAALIEAAGKDVAVAVTVAALVVLIGSYVRIGLLTARSFEDEDAKERLPRQAETHFLIMLGAPMVIVAAHPWGLATVAVAGAVLLFQLVFVHTMIVAGLIRQGRVRKTPPA